MITPFRVAILSHDPLYHAGLISALAGSARIEVLPTAPSARPDITDALPLQPDVVLIDLENVDASVAVVQRVVQSSASRVAVLTPGEHAGEVQRYLQAGARACIQKEVSARELPAILEAVHAGEVFISRHLALTAVIEAVRSPSGLAAERTATLLRSLTVREQQVLRELKHGYSNKVIAKNLDVQEKTVKHHLTSLMGKLGVRNRVQAALLAQDL